MSTVLAVVSSPSVTITVQPWIPALSLQVDKTTGRPGDVFLFSGFFGVDSNILPGRTITLFMNGTSVGQAVTNDVGYYEIPWTANYVGTLTFHSEGEYP